MATTKVAATAVTNQVQLQDSYRTHPAPTTTTNAGAVSSDISPEIINALITILGPDQCPRSAS